MQTGLKTQGSPAAGWRSSEMGYFFTLPHAKWATKTQHLHRWRGAVFYCLGPAATHQVIRLDSHGSAFSPKLVRAEEE